MSVIRSVTQPPTASVVVPVDNVSNFGLLPTQVAGLQVWLDSADIDTLWQDDGRTTPVTADGDPVGAWDDKSGNDRHFTQANNPDRPTYKTDFNGSKAGLSFPTGGSGSIDLDYGYLSGSTSDWTIFVVVSVANENSTNRYITDSSTNRLILGTLAGELGWWHSTQHTNGISPTPAGTYLLTYRLNSGTIGQMRKNGVTDFVDTYTLSNVASANSVLGGRTDGANDWDGYIASYVIYNTNLTTEEIIGVERYLALRYGFSYNDTWTPWDIPGLEVWYDHSDISTLWQDDGRTTPVTSPGDPVGAWDDKSGNGAHVTQATAGNRPSYESDGVLFVAANNDWLEQGSYMPSQTPMTAFAVFKSSVEGCLWGIANSLVFNQVYGSDLTAGTIRFYKRNTNFYSATSAGSSYDDNNPHISTAVAAATNDRTLWVDGADEVNDTNNSPDFGTADVFSLGQLRDSTPGSALTGHLMEIIYYDSVLSGVDRAKVESYLKAKWGI